MAQINLRVSDKVKAEMKKVALANGFGGVSGYLKFLHNSFIRGEKWNTSTDTKSISPTTTSIS